MKNLLILLLAITPLFAEAQTDTVPEVNYYARFLPMLPLKAEMDPTISMMKTNLTAFKNNFQLHWQQNAPLYQARDFHDVIRQEHQPLQFIQNAYLMNLDPNLKEVYKSRFGRTNFIIGIFNDKEARGRLIDYKRMEQYRKAEENRRQIEQQKLLNQRR